MINDGYPLVNSHFAIENSLFAKVDLAMKKW